METIKQILMRRDSLSAEEAQSMINEAREEVTRHFSGLDGRDPEEILYEDFGLEPDHVWELFD